MNAAARYRRVFLAIAIALTIPLAGCEPGAEPAQSDWQPPPFSATHAEGGSFDYPQSLVGPTVVLFWASWCPYCKALMPHLQSILDEYDGRVEVLALNIRDDGDPAEFLAEYGYAFSSIPDGDAAAQAWGVKATPGLFLADRSGRIVFSRGAIPESAYRVAGPTDPGELKHYQRAARRAPLWAARLRQAIDRLLARG